MKNVLILILLLATALKIHAQTVTYTYDAAGNRIARVVTLPAVIRILPSLPLILIHVTVSAN